ncbi:MAG: Superfamily II DNA or RNA helicase, SNF2 family [Verrucomicrobia bacterium]|nr:MAG: Superfamily II DNA or RNA helicase, SNF2 family [Verrucomicrobiota bacterium]
MKPDRATLNFLNSFPDDCRKEGERLQKDGCVTKIFGNHLRVQGRVEDGGALCRTTLHFRVDVWEGECSCREAERCSSIVATMLERLERGGEVPEAPNEVDDQSLTEILEERLQRELTPNEAQFLDKLEKRYRRFEVEGQLVDHDLVRLNAKWPVESYDPIQLWPVPPADILEFWNYVAYHFRARNLSYPKFMEIVTDLAKVEAQLRDWEMERAEEEWRRIVCDVPASLVVTVQEVEFRILLTTTEARLQWRPIGAEAAYVSIQHPEKLVELRERHARGEFRMNDQSALLAEAFLAAVGPGELATLRLEDRDQAAVLNRLFHAPQASGRIVNLDERVIQRVDATVSWRASVRQDGEGLFVDLHLIGHDGEPIPHAVRLLPGNPNLYLGDEQIFPGPMFFQSGTEVLPCYEIPRSLIWTEAGVEFLTRIDAALPPALQAVVIDSVLRVKLQLRLSQKISGTETEQFIVELEAEDQDRTRREVMEKDGWIIESRGEVPPGTIYRYDRTGLLAFPALLEPLNLSWDPVRQSLRTRITKSFPERFVEWYRALPADIEVGIDEHLRTLLADPVKASVTFDIVSSEIDWFDLKIVVNVEGLNLSTNEIRALVAARGGFVRMQSGGWLRLEFDLTESQTRAVNRLGLDPFDLSGESHRMHVLQLSDSSAREVFDAAAWEKICERSNALSLEVKPGVPQKLQLQLRPYQIEGFHFLAYLSANRFGGILADDMGLGKTVQSITWLLWLQEQAPERVPALVVCPKSVLDVWAGEVRKFAPHLRVKILRNKLELEMDEIRGLDVLVLNYSQLRVNIEDLVQIHWLAIILDEGQQIKNPDSKAAKAAREIQAENRLVLTGTPIENRLLDIWSLMAFAMPGVLGSRKYFRERFDRRRDPLCQERLSARLRPFLVRRTKDQVAVDLPPRTEEDVLCKMDDVQEELYKSEVERIQQVLLGCENDGDFNTARFTVLQGLTRLRQICCHPGLFDRSYLTEESAKFTALFYLLDQLRAEGHKVLVFSQFVTMLEIIRERLAEEDRPHLLLTGQTKDRQKVIEDFQTSKDPTVFLLSLKAGGSGLNLTAASYVVLYDPWWNPAVENQAIDRTHRIGQVNKVIAYRLLMRDSVEEKIRVLQQQKQAVSAGVLGEEGFAKSLTRDDLRFLFAPVPSDGNGNARG